VLDQNGFLIAIDNIYLAGVEIVKSVLGNWDCTFKKGVKPTNYIGDIFGSLAGEPDFGPGSLTEGKGYNAGGNNPDTHFKRSFVPGKAMARKRAVAAAAAAVAER
jgi:purine nucleoside permease (NUP)